MIIAGIVLVILTFYLIIKNYETRTVLMLSGFIMALIGGNVSAALDGFVKGMVNPSIAPVICVTMGFSAVLDYTGCSKHLVVFITKVLRHAKFVVIPATVILVFLLNTSLLSASGLSAAVGMILIPALMRLGMKPAMAGSTVLLGTWGSSISPANPFIIQVADLANENVMVILTRFVPVCFLSACFAAVLLLIIAKVRKETSGFEGTAAEAVDSAEEKMDNNFRVNPLYAIIPIVPIIVLLLASPMFKVLPSISITNAMLLGTALCFLVARPNLREFANTFFKGNGSGFVNIVILMAAANMFIQGMNTMGLVQAMIDAMASSTAIAKVSAVFGPFIVAVVSGSGNAAVLAFNGAVTPFAPTFGLNIGDMGAVVQAAGNLGRTMSPVAGSVIICAKIAGVSPMDLAKRTGIPCIAAGILMMTLMFFI